MAHGKIDRFGALAVVAVALNSRAWRDWAPLTLGLTFAFSVIIFGPLTGGSFNPARWFGPALVSGEYGGTWPYILGPLVGALLAAALYRFVPLPRETDEVVVQGASRTTGAEGQVPAEKGRGR